MQLCLYGHVYIGSGIDKANLDIIIAYEGFVYKGTSIDKPKTTYMSLLRSNFLKLFNSIIHLKSQYVWHPTR
jgi:hypothetical protein